jgi:hypothetical protein
VPQVFDRQTVKPVELPPEQLAAGLVDGSLALDATGGPVPLRSKDGTIYHADPSKVAHALSTGAYSLLTPQEELEHRVAKEEAAKGTLGSLASGLESAANQATFGVEGAIARGGETPEQLAERDAREKYHQTARLLGGAAGFGASMLAGGELFKGAELAGQAASRGILPAEEVAHAALATKVAAKAADYATQGALLSSPQAIVQAAFGDPKQAAETLLWGVGAGAVLGGGAELLAGAGRTLGEAAGGVLGKGKIAQKLEEYAQTTTPTAIGAQRGQVNKLSPEWREEVTNFAHEEGLIQAGMSKQDVAEAIKSSHSKYSGQIGETLSALDGAVAKAKPEVLDAALKPGQLGAEIRKAFDMPEMRMEMNADQARAIDIVARDADRIATKTINGQEVVPFDEAQKFLTMLREKHVKAIGRAENAMPGGLQIATPLDEAKASAYQVVKSVMHQAGDQVALASEQPALVGKLVADKRALALTVEIEKWAANNAAREAGNRTVGLTDFLHMGEGGIAGKATQAIGAGIGGLIGGPTGALVGMAAGKVAGLPLDYLSKHWMEDKGLIVLSALAKTAAKEGPEVFSAVMASEGAKRLEATMSGVQETVRRMATAGIEATSTRTTEHMKSLLGSTSGLTGDQAYDKLGARLNDLASNPAALASATSAVSAPFASTAPEVAAAYQQQLAGAITYLHAAFPKPPAPPAPFAPQTWQPTAQDKMAFHDKAEIVANPMAAMAHVQRGTLSDAHLDALRTVYPAIYSQMATKVLEFSAAHPDVKLALPERSSVAKFLGGPLDTMDEPGKLQILQASYGAGAPNKAPDEQPSGSKPARGKFEKMPQAAATMFASTQGESPR